MDEPEDLMDEKTLVLLFSLRDCKTRTYSPKVEKKLLTPKDAKHAKYAHLE